MTNAYIVGCGPNGHLGYAKMKRDNLIILCNASIKVAEDYRVGRFSKGFDNIMWMISDGNIPKLPWFYTYYEKYKHILWGGDQIIEKVKCAHSFKENPWFAWNDLRLVEGSYRGGGSIVGCAMQHCLYNDLIPTLVGVDMCGPESISHPGKETYKPDHWEFKKHVLNHLIKTHLPETTTLTETALDVKKVWS